MYLPQDIIRIKRNKGTLTSDQIACFVDGLTNNSFNDAQVGAMAMAIWLNGMTVTETVELTKHMMNSGQVLAWPDIDGPVVDKHSTGGVGDKVSFMLAAIVACCDVYIPMISGRGLGHTGGTSDKLESIANVDIQPSVPNFQNMVRRDSAAIITQTSDLAPADKRLYSIRDISGTVESIPLITASILSKKLASGLDALTMDVKVGNGAMMKDLASAKKLAQSIVNVANGAGVKTQAIITDMNQVLGHSAGNALEMIETIDYLTGKYRDPRLHQVTVELAISMLMTSGAFKDKEAAKAKINQVLESGQAAEKFAQMISALGGPTDYMENPWAAMNKAKVVQDIQASEDGYIGEVDTFGIGMAVVGLRGGRTFNGQQIDHSVGFDKVLAKGSKVQKGDVIARVHAANESAAQQASDTFLSAISLHDSPPEVEAMYTCCSGINITKRQILLKKYGVCNFM